MPMSSEEPLVAYQIYLLRMRQRTATTAQDATGHKRAIEWQIILAHPYTGARRTFDSLEALVAFLRDQINS